VTTPDSSSHPNAAVPDEDAGYIRGGAGTIDGRRAARLAVGVLLGLLAVFVVALFVEAIRTNARNESLRKHGVTVTVTVTNCLGVATGTGITVTGYICHGSFTFNGKSYNDVIGKSSIPRTAGQTLQGVVDASNPAVLSASTKAATAHASWTSFVAAGCLLVLLMVVWFFARPLFRRADSARDLVAHG
jgi:hypothetical protein